ncbi:5-methyltetrahydropteroyltriglutamate--homocysteine S-methyltransferase [Edaphobacter dinghuensis]|uniref:5-methyltetrahydropteroyltriglutamate--homocysteine methyltransferase n=1 Tax=Edaphobacter dinghuensis TaxID=1560005 RepID=A0A917M3Y5_9BACT|nr:5-methyltetrahydropteroyltriglutamate--homocysteine S-methyltransferase [Edaphobacter dinghuensis]GGG73926.1 5-methyltetrahydropteroyltriglutamate--homocysteine methyltransferase [Edaphobacter dinghuensis]
MSSPSQSTTNLVTANLGYPRIGRHRELKFALEEFWRGRLSEADLLATAKTLRQRNWQLQKDAGLDVIPSNDFSFYDQVLDALVLVGATPSRFGAGPVTLTRYFQMARNSNEQTAMEMTKWFDTNYHYLVPEWSDDLAFTPDTTKLLAEFAEAKSLGIATRPVLIGPVTLLLLGKAVDGTNPLDLLPRLLKAYRTVLGELAAAGAEWVQIDEAVLVTDLPEGYAAAFRSAYVELANIPLKLMLTTYFGELGDNLELACSLGTAGLHIDAVRAPKQVAEVVKQLQPTQTLSLGCVDGRNIWLADLNALQSVVTSVTAKIGAERLQLAPSCSLLHVPYDTADEDKLDPRVLSWLSFAKQKVEELVQLAQGPEVAATAFADNRRRHEDRLAADSSTNKDVREQLATLSEGAFRRKSPYQQRVTVQREELGLPLLPTTTIGSFPQTQEVRKQRAAHKKGTISDAEYNDFLKQKTEECIREQEQIGLDVLVHGEFERNDMVEYFGEHLAGFTFTSNGWVQSYGSRCVKPPIIYGDVSRVRPITVEWSSYASSLTTKPMKGMLTGPITILQWSFVRNDIPERDVAWQIGLALREEVQDLEAAGIRVIQVDEPALREGLPLRRSEWPAYLDWSVKAFRLATSSVTDGTQIHTHMCYCQFEDILPSIAALDADVISMETARSRMEMLHAFKRHGYPNEIGPGIYDIHSPRVPAKEEMVGLLQLALDVLRPEQLWVNPDCGLKTRAWPETIEALTNLCQAAVEIRAELT